MDNCTTNLISTNQVIEVGIRKPKCLDFKNNTLNDWLKWITETICCLKEDCEESVTDLTINSTWSIIRTPKIYRRGNLIHLSGEITGGDVSSTICNLSFTPSERRIIPIAHEFTPTSTYSVFLKIDVDRTVKLYFTGTAPTGTSSKLYLDNISFFTE